MKNGKAEIEKLQRELKTETAKNGRYSKRAIFLMATINIYSKEAGTPAPYEW